MPSESRPTQFHPLANCDCRTFLRIYSQHRPYSRESRRSRRIAWAGMLVQVPGNAIERRVCAGRIRDHALADSPTFVVGHWRSGTTFLHNVLTRTGRFATINLAQTARPLGAMRFSRAFQRFLERILPEKRLADGVALTPREPQEEEMALGLMGDICAYYSAYFPRDALRNTDRSVFLQGLETGEIERFAENYRTLAAKISLLDGGTRPLLFKNPANTARMDFLRDTFPGVRFIHIIRNPTEVIRSAPTMMNALADEFTWHGPVGRLSEDDVIDCYRRMMQAHLEQREKVDPGRYIEVRYEELKGDPLKTVETIYGHFGWDLDDATRGRVREYLDSISGFTPTKRGPDPELSRRLAEDLDFAYRKWGYEA